MDYTAGTIKKVEESILVIKILIGEILHHQKKLEELLEGLKEFHRKKK